MGRLVLLQTTPRLPAGLLSGAAWRALLSADVVAAAAESALTGAVRAEGVEVSLWPRATAADLLARCEQGADLVWLADDDTESALTRELAGLVVSRAEEGRAGPEVEICIGSYDLPGARLLDLTLVMDRLRRECPWDQEQTHESLVRYLLEEAHETIEAIETGDRAHLREELGDLLLQVMFHARIAAEHPDQPFDIDDVAGQIVEKLVRRHPHVFSDTEVEGAADVEANWETIKAAEKSRSSVTEGIPAALPALSLAEKVVSRAVRGGATLSVPAPDESAYDAETLGEVLFALVAAARASGIDPEQALRQRVRREMDAIRAAEQAGPARVIGEDESDH